jgi:mannose-6-phosphate isomerase-like protein (cupin superfamily)
MPFNEDIVRRAKANAYFREVLTTGPHSQVVVMSIPPGGDIGEEVHDDVDQTLVFVQGRGKAILNGQESSVGPGSAGSRPCGNSPQLREHWRRRSSAVHDLRAA